MFKYAQKSFGFTLVELMVVITILGILSAIGLVVYTNLQPGARDSRRVQDMLESQKALEQYFFINHAYPPGPAGGADLTTLSGLINYFSNGTNSLPVDPNLTQTGNYGYQYFKCPTAEKYVLCARLETTSNNANRGVTPASGEGCNSAADNNTPKIYFCRGSLSN